MGVGVGMGSGPAPCCPRSLSLADAPRALEGRPSWAGLVGAAAPSPSSSFHAPALPALRGPRWPAGPTGLLPRWGTWGAWHEDGMGRGTHTSSCHGPSVLWKKQGCRGAPEHRADRGASRSLPDPEAALGHLLQCCPRAPGQWRSLWQASALRSPQDGLVGLLVPTRLPLRATAL